MVTMKCSKCGFENKDKAKFCTKCGNSLDSPVEGSTNKSDNSKYVIIALVAVIIILVGTIGYFAVGSLNNDPVQVSDNSNNTSDSSPNQVDDSSADEGNDAKTEVVSSSKTSESTSSKEWVSIGKYSGSGSGSKTINVPEGKIMIKLSAYPIKNYATNYLHVSGSNGKSGGVNWGSSSAVETRSDSFSYTSSSEEVFTIDYYETVNWEVEFFKYQ